LKLTAWLWLFFTLAAITGGIYALFAAALLRRFGEKPAPMAGPAPNLTILKPLCGAEPGLEANLASLCDQDYGGAVQLVFGLHDSADPARGVVERLRARFPRCDIDLVIDSRKAGASGKVSNLINMLPRARYDILVVADSDIRVGKDYLREVVSTLSAPGVGIATCLYCGLAEGGLWSRLSAAAINHHFLPNVLVGVELGLAQPCFGATMALRSETLRRIGGFEAFADVLADDYAMGQAVRREDMRVAIVPILVDHVCSERSFGELLQKEFRWARTFRQIEPWGYAGLAVTHPLPLALIAAAFGGFGAISLAIVAIALACRLSIPIQLRALRGGKDAGFRISPLRDVLSFAVFLASFLPGPLTWRGRRFVLRPDGTLKQT
jgi:ceramide glucosyltransferase